MHKGIKIIALLLLFGLLVVIRMFASTLFYDPLITFFKINHTTDGLPAMDDFRLLSHVALRFLLNTVISMAILWVLFEKKEILKFSLFLYSIAFAILMSVFFVLIQSDAEGGHITLFYVRRFLIQPLLVLILIPAFYFQKKT